MSLLPSTYLLWKMSLIFFPFLNRVVFFYVELCELFIYVAYFILYQGYHLEICSHFWQVVFFLLSMVSFPVQKLLWSIRSYLFIFPFFPLRFKNIFLQFLSKVFYWFSSRSFTVFGITFQSLIHFDLICVYGIRECSNFILLHTVFSAPLTEVTQSVQSLIRVWLCYPMDCSTPGLPVHHQLPQLAQTHVHRVCDAIQPSHPLSSPSPPAFHLSQHQGLFQWLQRSSVSRDSRSPVFPILLFSSISLHWSLRKAFLSLLAILWNSAFKWEYLSFSPLPFTSLLFTAIWKASSDSHFAFLHFFFLGMVLIPVSYTMSQTSDHSSSGILSIRSSPLNLFLTSIV